MSPSTSFLIIYSDTDWNTFVGINYDHDVDGDGEDKDQIKYNIMTSRMTQMTKFMLMFTEMKMMIR